MYKKLKITLIALFCLSLVSCSKDATFNEFTTELDSTTNEILNKIDSNPTAAGVDEAQKAFDAKKPALREKLKAIKSAFGFQVSEDARKKFTESIFKNRSAVETLKIKYVTQVSNDAEFRNKLEAFVNDYQNTLKFN